jgi:hypothetical protein
MLKRGKAELSHGDLLGFAVVRAVWDWYSLAARSCWRYKTSMSTLNSAKKPKGRPKVDSEAVNVRLTRDALERVDDWRRAQADVPTRPEAIRRLVEKGLTVIQTPEQR